MLIRGAGEGQKPLPIPWRVHTVLRGSEWPGSLKADGPAVANAAYMRKQPSGAQPQTGIVPGESVQPVIEQSEASLHADRWGRTRKP